MTLLPFDPSVRDYLALSEALKQLRGVDFETHAHPAVVLDRATPPATLVWGWWADAQPALPCLLWQTERGWSVAVVEPGALDSEGYERAFWSHRITLLDLALANALGPFATLQELERTVATDGSFGFGSWAADVTAGVLWGIHQLLGARDRAGCEQAPGPIGPLAHGWVDLELARYGLVPSLTKSRRSVERAQEAGLEALMRAVRRTAVRGTPLDGHGLAPHG